MLLIHYDHLHDEYVYGVRALSFEWLEVIKVADNISYYTQNDNVKVLIDPKLSPLFELLYFE